MMICFVVCFVVARCFVAGNNTSSTCALRTGSTLTAGIITLLLLFYILLTVSCNIIIIVVLLVLLFVGQLVIGLGLFASATSCSYRVRSVGDIQHQKLRL
jgi:hypothetical protein